jgi:hypothetical protein
LIALAVVGHRDEEFYQVFLGQFTARLGGTPLYLTLLASVAYYTYAALRRVPAATEAISVALAGLAFVSPSTLDLDGLVSPGTLPILAIAVLQLGLGLRKRDAWRCLIGACCLGASAMISLPGTGGSLPRGPIAIHLILIASLVVGAAFNDPLGRLLRSVGAVAALLGCLIVLTGRIGRIDTFASWTLEIYPLVMTILIAGYGYLLKHRISLVVAGIVLGFWMIAIGWRWYSHARQTVVGLDYLATGMVLFALAVLTCVIKGGILPWGFWNRKGKVPDSLD